MNSETPEKIETTGLEDRTRERLLLEEFYESGEVIVAFREKLDRFQEEEEKREDIEERILRGVKDRTGALPSYIKERIATSKFSAGISALREKRRSFSRRLRAAVLLGLFAFAAPSETLAAPRERASDDSQKIALALVERSSSGMSRGYLESMGPELKTLAMHGGKEWLFILDEYAGQGTAILAYGEAGVEGAHYDGSKIERLLSSAEGRVVMLHTHTLEFLLTLFTSKEFQGERDLLDVARMDEESVLRQIEYIRDGKMPPIPHPPSPPDFFFCLGNAVKLIDTEKTPFRASVADSEGVWEFSVVPDARGIAGWNFLEFSKRLKPEMEIPLPIRTEFQALYQRLGALYGGIISPYSEKATKRFASGDAKGILEERKRKDGKVEEFKGLLEKIGVRLEFHPYKTSPLEGQMIAQQ